MARTTGSVPAGRAPVTPTAPTAPTAAGRPVTPGPTGRPAWLRRYQAVLIALDGLLLLTTVLGTLAVHTPVGSHQLHGLPYLGVALGIGLVWWLALALTRTYESRFIGTGPEEFRRVQQASVRIAATVGVVCYVGHLPLSREVVALLLLFGTLLLLAGRLLGRGVLRFQRARGAWGYRVVVVGTLDRVTELTTQLSRTSSYGYRVVGVCVPEGRAELSVPAGLLTEIGALVARSGADSVAVTAGPALTSDALRLLGYELEGTGVDLLVAPSLLDVAGARIRVDQVAGLPWLHLDEVRVSLRVRIGKSLLDRLLAASVLALLSPVLLACCVALRLTGDRSVLVSERRIGQDGAGFQLLRLRCAGRRLVVDGQQTHRLDQLLDRLLVGDLPTLVNVLRGQMSIVGPRPHGPDVTGGAGPDPRRRLVKPGLTGLAQVSDRTGLTLHEAALLDHQYVDNWTLGLDLQVILRTATLLVRGRRLG